MRRSIVFTDPGLTDSTSDAYDPFHLPLYDEASPQDSKLLGEARSARLGGAGAGAGAGAGVGGMAAAVAASQKPFDRKLWEETTAAALSASLGPHINPFDPRLALPDEDLYSDEEDEKSEHVYASSSHHRRPPPASTAAFDRVLEMTTPPDENVSVRSDSPRRQMHDEESTMFA